MARKALRQGSSLLGKAQYQLKQHLKAKNRQSDSHDQDRRELFDAPGNSVFSILHTDRGPFDSIASRLKLWAGLVAGPEAANETVRTWLIGKAEGG